MLHLLMFFVFGCVFMWFMKDKLVALWNKLKAWWK